MQKIYKTPTVKAKVPSSSKDGSFCKYSHRVCMQNCIDGYEFCARHILEDKTAPFKQCTYMTKSGKRCPVAAPKQDRKDGYCAEHAKKSLIARQRFARKRKPKETAESLLEELVTLNTGSLMEASSTEHRRGKSHTDSIASKALEYASSSESESEQTIDQFWREDEDSDAESIDSEQEDLLKYAGIYTAEEVAQILRDKLVRLQILYIDQFKRLQHIFHNRRRRYLQAYKSERETMGSIKLYKNDPHQRDKYDKLCALKRYHKLYGKEALLQKQETEKRRQITDVGVISTRPSQTFQKCVFVDEGLRCNSRVVPLSKYCQRHILHDAAQVLFKPCPFADGQCGRPVPTIFNTKFCSLHQPIPPLQVADNLSNEDNSKTFEAKAEAEDSRDILNEPNSETSLKIKEEDIKPEVKYEMTESSGSPMDQGCSGDKGVVFTLGEEDEEEVGQSR